MDWDDNDESYSDRGDRLSYSDEDSSNYEEEDHQCGDYHEDQQSQSEDIDVSPLLWKSHKNKIDLAKPSVLCCQGSVQVTTSST